MEEIEDSGHKGKARRIYTSTVVSTSMVLLMIGLISLIGIHAENLANYIKENIILTVILNEDAADADAVSLQKEINAHAYVKKSVYISKETAAKTLTKDLGEDFIHFLGYNPLTASIDIYLKPRYAVRDSISEIKSDLGTNSIVKEINYQQSLVESINHNIRTIFIILAVFAVILLIVAILIIFVTVRLAIYSRRFLIKSMQLVGATRGFIIRPFLGIGVINGLLAGIVAAVLLLALLWVAQREFPEIVQLQDRSQFIYVFACVLVLGVLLSFISTFFAVNKYLRTNADRLYY